LGGNIEGIISIYTSIGKESPERIVKYLFSSSSSNSIVLLILIGKKRILQFKKE